MSFSARIRESIQELHLLSHPFYQAWTEGRLSQGELGHYAQQYVPFVDAFPRFVSALHSQCEDAEARADIMENLMDEEGANQRSAPHPQLWRDFIAGLGVDAASEGYDAAALALKDEYLRLTRSSFAEGLCALYAYEYQTPEISKSKVDGLERFYGLRDDASLAFFRVHETADVYHSQACEKWIDRIPAEDQGKALAAARTAAQGLWDFLTAAYGGKAC